MSDQRVAIPGSAPPPEIEQRWFASVSPDWQVTSTIVIRRRADSSAPTEADLLSGNFKPISRESAALAMGADPGDLESVRAFAQQYGLAVIKEDPAARTLQVSGSARQIGDAFGISLSHFSEGGNEYSSYHGPLTIPASLAGIIVAVLGLDQRPVAKHHMAFRDNVQ